MTRPRSTLVSLSDTAWYHVVSRCVRRAFLCGEDAHTGKNVDHRRGWIEARIRQLALVFTIDVAACAVMSNRYHTVLRVDAQRAQCAGKKSQQATSCIIGCPAPDAPNECSGANPPRQTDRRRQG